MDPQTENYVTLGIYGQTDTKDLYVNGLVNHKPMWLWSFSHHTMGHSNMVVHRSYCPERFATDPTSIGYRKTNNLIHAIRESFLRTLHHQNYQFTTHSNIAFELYTAPLLRPVTCSQRHYCDLCWWIIASSLLTYPISTLAIYCQLIADIHPISTLPLSFFYLHIFVHSVASYRRSLM